MRNTLGHASHALRNAVLSPGTRLFGPRFAVDYLVYAARAWRSWNADGSGELRLLGNRIHFLDHGFTLGSVHDIFVSAIYAFHAGRPDPLIVDAGANIGVATLFFKSMYPQGRILAFEPQPGSFEELRRNVEENDIAGVELYQAGVSDVDGVITLYDNPDHDGGINVSIDPGWASGREFTAPAMRLSPLLDEPVDFLKLNVEGSEYGVIGDLIATGKMDLIREAAICWHNVGGETNGAARMTAMLESAGMRVRPVFAHPDGTTGILRAARPAAE